MTGLPSSRHRSHHGTLDEYLAAADIVPLRPLAEADWNRLRRATGARLAWRFATWRNLWRYRGHFTHDAFGFAWGGIYRTLLVGSIVTTSYRNEGLLRAAERIEGTCDFFRGGFNFSRSSPESAELVRIVNLRHHVAGVVSRTADGGYRVNDGYEADYAYVATAFIESIRRGLGLNGLAPDSPRGQALAEQICTVLYQVAGFTGLQRMPRDLAAHDRFRDAYDGRLRERQPSRRVRRMAAEIARRIVPVTAAHAAETVPDHVRRHLDPEKAGFLFTDSDTHQPDLETQRREWMRRLAAVDPLAAIRSRSAARAALWKRPDIAALWNAYGQTAPGRVDDRLIAAILMHMVDEAHAGGTPLPSRTIELAADEPLVREGHAVHEMVVVLSATAPLVVLKTVEVGSPPRLVATITPPSVYGEIGMWRGCPAVATVTTRVPNRLEVLVVDEQRMTALREDAGFRAAIAAEIQWRLAVNARLVGTTLDDAAARSGDARLASIAQLFRYLSGDSSGDLDAVIGLAEDATPVECVEALRGQVDEALAAEGLDGDVVRFLEQVRITIG